MILLLPASATKLTATSLLDATSCPKVVEAYRRLQATEYLLDALPIASSASADVHRAWMEVSMAFINAFTALEVAAFSVKAAKHRASLGPRLADEDYNVALQADKALARLARDVPRMIASIEARGLTRITDSPSRAVFGLRAKLRGLRNGFSSLRDEGWLTVEQVKSFGHLLVAAPLLSTPPVSAFDYARERLPEYAALFDLVREHGEPAGRSTRPRAHQPLAERRAYMRDYMKAYRDRRKAAKAAPPAEAEAIDPLS